MMLSVKMIYEQIGFQDPDLFESKIITDNLFRLEPLSVEDDLHRRTGKTTRLIIDAISLASEGDKSILLVSWDANHRDFLSAEVERILRLVSVKYTAFNSSISDSFLIDNLNSKIEIMAANAYSYNMSINYDIVYHDE
jgi:hypothetical protein